jgi:dihydrolipoamide dehydrogenase
MAQYDVIIIGGGPGGYNAAVRAGQLGLKTAIIEGRGVLGGTCLNVGCMPSKALLHASELYEAAKGEFATLGIEVSPKLNLVQMMKQKTESVTALTKGVEFLMKKNKVDYLKGWGSIEGAGKVSVKGDDGKSETHEAKNIIIATGSEPSGLPGVEVDNKRIVDSTGALSLPEVPKKLIVIGAGIIGLELGSVWRRLGAEVTVLEALPDFLGTADADVAKVALKELGKLGLDIKLGAKLAKAEVKKKEVHLTYADKDGEHKLVVDKLLVAVGRRAYTDGLLSDDCGVKLDERGRIVVDEHCHTGVDGVWAVGDAVRGPMLAHKGFEEGMAVAEWIAGKAGHVNYDTIPWVIYTEPEIAWAGKTEKQLKEEGVPYKVGSFPFAAIGRAVAMNEAVGMVKMIAHAETDRILGVHMVGPGVSELIAECVVAMEFKGSAEDMARIIHAHPTLSEAVHEAALSVDKRAIHKGN